MTFRSLILAAMAALAAGAAGSAAQAAAPPAAKADRSACFYSRNVDGFSPVDKETVNIRVGVRDVYQLKILGFSTDIDWAQRIALVSRGGGSFICDAMDADLLVPSTTGGQSQRFPLSSLRKLTAAEIAALPKNQKP